MTVFVELLVKNAEDIAVAERGIVSQDKVRQATANFKVDTGAHKNIISKELFQQLGLRVTGKKMFGLAGGHTAEFEMASPIAIYWNDRETVMPAVISPRPANNLLSITALELLGLKVNPLEGRLESAFEGDIVGELE